jgi:hypothetical protein
MPRNGRSLRWFATFLAAMALATPSCMEGGHFTLGGYTFGPLHDTRYRTIFVPIVENRAFQDGPFRGLEYSLTETLQQEIEKTTPWKVVRDRQKADTELLVTIVQTPKNILNRNQLNEVREGEIVIQVELVWRDVRSGEILSKPGPGRGAPPPKPLSPEDPIPKVTAVAHGRFLPEVGESTTTAIQRASKQLAVEIVSKMEKPW